MRIDYLKFDSELANRRIGRCLLSSWNEKTNAKILAPFKQYDLVYLVNKFQPDISLLLKNFDWLLADIKITLRQNLNKIIFDKMELTQNDFYQPTDKDRIVKLGTDLYKTSRFYFDKNTRRLGKKIYRAWIHNSINKTEADKIIVERNRQKKVIGFITLKLRPSFAELVLLKVDKNHIGQGHGRALTNKLYNFIANKTRSQEIRVCTQLKNAASLQLYQSAGFDIIDYDFVYHLFPQGFLKI